MRGATQLFSRTGILILTISTAFLIFSCQKDDSAAGTDGEIVLENAASLTEELEIPSQMWHQTNKKICVLYGYGYNDEDFIQNMNQRLYSRFGSAEEGGLIMNLRFPEDFKRGSKVFITTLQDLLSNVDLQGLILIGAPEGTHIAIARMQDSWGGSLPFPVFALFPQDDVLGIEDSSDFVLDKAQKAEINGIITEEEQSYVHEVPSILENCASFIACSDSPFEKNAKLYEIVRKICRDLKIERYSDPDTSLISINHFVLE